MRRLMVCSQSEVNPSDLEFSHFLNLPPELILYIAKFLPPESSATLALSCSALYSCLNIQYLKPMQHAENRVLNAFLLLLERDKPRHILCPDCYKFHPMSSAIFYRRPNGAHANAPPLKQCQSVEIAGDLPSTIHSEFSSTVFRITMKAHRQGYSTVESLKQLGYERKNVDHEGYVEQRSARAKIHDGKLLLREQRVFMIPISQKTPLPWHGGIIICAHIQFITMMGLPRQGIRIPVSGEVHNHRNTEGIIYCAYCFTEFQVDFKSYGNAGNAMFLTRWMDIGEGIDPDDFKWKSRFWNSVGRLSSGPHFRRGSICAAFEQMPASEFKFDSVLSRQDEAELMIRSPFPWPDDITLSSMRDRQYFAVEEGRFVPFD